MVRSCRMRLINRKGVLRRTAVIICPVIVVLFVTTLPFRFYRASFVTKDGRRLAMVGEIFSDSKTADLVRALSRLDTNEADKLIKQGADINQRGELEVTPLLYFLAHQEVEAVELTLGLGADPDLAAEGIDSPLYYVMLTDRWQELMKILVNAGADVAKASDLSQLYKNSAIEHRVLKRLNWDGLLDKGRGATVGLGAAGDQHNEVAAAKGLPDRTAEPLLWLLDHGGNVNAQDFVGRTLLFVADEVGWDELTLELLERGANPFVETKSGRSFARWFEADKAKFLNTTFSEAEQEQRRPIQEKIDLLRQDPQKIREAREIDAAYARFLEVYRTLPHGTRNLHAQEDIGRVVEKFDNLVEQAERREGEQGEQGEEN
jgi:hypothetical protein